MKRVLITGISGFLGSNTAKFFIDKGFRVVGIDICNLQAELNVEFHKSDISIDKLKSLKCEFQYIVHCAGGSTVGQSIKEPFDEFNKTINSTMSILEYIRLYNKDSKLIYPSSAAVYGNDYEKPIKESDVLNPISPYGCYKRIVEELCESYYNNFGVKSNIIRFFSIYGEGLKKQLLWDACNKIENPNLKNEFFGTGEEIRDWLYIKDAINLIYKVASNGKDFDFFNGGTGNSVKINKIVSLLSEELNNNDYFFNNQTKAGDPQCFIADINKQLSVGWKNEYKVEQGIKNYVKWYKQN